MDGFWLADLEGHLVEVNETYCRMTGYTEEELLTKSISDLEANETPDQTMARIQWLMVHGEARFESQHRRKDGTTFDVEVSCQLQPGDCRCMVAFLHDITRRKEAERNLRNLSLRNQTMLQTASDGIHVIDLQGNVEEVNQAFCNMLGYSRDELLQMNVADWDLNWSREELVARIRGMDARTLLGFTRMMAEDLPSLRLDEIQKIATSMSNSASNLYELLENLLKWSMMQRGLLSFNPVPFLLTKGIESLNGLLGEAADRKKIKISYQVPPGLMIMSDEQMFESIIRNLVLNAVKFTNPGGRIEIAAKQNADRSVEISVSDTGIGMSKDLMDKLFRTEAQTSRKGTEGELSTGLGLIICKDFITDKKLAQEELLHSYELLNKLAAQVPGVVYQYRLYPDGRSAFPFNSPGISVIYELDPADVCKDAEYN